MNRYTAFVVVCCALMGGAPAALASTSREARDAAIDQIRQQSEAALADADTRAERNAIRHEEAQAMRPINQAYWSKRPPQDSEGIPNRASRVFINGGYDNGVSMNDQGSVLTLTFAFTRLTDDAVLGTMDATSVAYYASLDPFTTTLTFLGSSSNAASGFQLTWTPTGFEPTVWAFPSNASGLMFINDGDGANMAQAAVTVFELETVPAPSAAALLAFAGVLSARGGRRRRDR